MFKEILYKEQLEIIGILKLFSSDFYLAGGTAIALQIGHRKSIDFDLFSSKKIDNSKIITKLKDNSYKIDKILIDNKGEELTLIISGVKITFLYFPFNIEIKNKFEGIGLPDIETLASIKFYTLGRRGKWKDYVDIYTILKNGFDFYKISFLAEKIFDGGYNEKLLREQLCYFEDIDYSEKVEFVGKIPNDEEIKNYLSNVAIKI